MLSDEELKNNLLYDLRSNVNYSGMFFTPAPADVARLIGEAVRRRVQRLQAEGRAAPLRNVYVDFDQLAISPKYRITLEFA